MAKKLTKALRGKRRWVGCICPDFEKRSELAEYLSKYPVRLYDYEEGKCILMVKLEDYESIKSELVVGKVISQTSSGKIRLVRERMEFSRKPRKR
ncbi:MAG: hypothetical protein HN544_06800 [Euryarchaeota archaeon]|jgi:hypothetical protein|nr:hypothetical protein [Euryarchaeota archaeon]